MLFFVSAQKLVLFMVTHRSLPGYLHQPVLRSLLLDAEFCIWLCSKPFGPAYHALCGSSLCAHNSANFCHPQTSLICNFRFISRWLMKRLTCTGPSASPCRSLCYGTVPASQGYRKEQHSEAMSSLCSYQLCYYTDTYTHKEHSKEK